MTHEKESDGSEHGTTLPDAGTVPTFGTAEESDLPALDGDLED